MMNGKMLLKSIGAYFQKKWLQFKAHWLKLSNLMDRKNIQLDTAEEGISKLDDRFDNTEWQQSETQGDKEYKIWNRS